MRKIHNIDNRPAVTLFEKFDGGPEAPLDGFCAATGEALQSEQHSRANRSLGNRVLDSWNGVRHRAQASQLVSQVAVERRVARRCAARGASRRMSWAGGALCALVLGAGGQQARADWMNGAPTTSVQMDSGRRGNVFYEGNPISFRLSAPGAVSYTVRDYYGQVVDSGPVSGTTLAVNVGQLGWYKIYLQGNVMQADWGNSVGGTTFVILRNAAQLQPLSGTGAGTFAQFPTAPDASNLGHLKVTRIDPTVNFNWGITAPSSILPHDRFSARWTGQVKANHTQTYTFYTRADDGARLWVNGQLLVNDWNNHAVTENKGTIALTQGQKYDIRMEYFDGEGAASAQLLWSSSSQAKQVIPQSSLFSSSASNAAPGLKGEYLDPSWSNNDPGVDSVMRGVMGIGPARHKVDDANDTAAAFARLDSDIALDKQFYMPYDPARKRSLLIAFPHGTEGKENGVRQIVARYKNDVEYWESRNEPNAIMTGADFAIREMKPFYEAVKSANPNAKVLGPGVVSINPFMLAWIEDFLKAGGGQYIDGFSFHAYNTVGGDPNLARECMNGLNVLLTKYGVAGKEKWQTEQGHFAAIFGSYEPRHQGRWTMVQMMMYEQFGIPKEHNNLWYDQNHGFWDYPAFWENVDGSMNPAAPLMRVWSEELYGTNFARTFDFGNPGNKLYIGSLFTGANKTIAAFMSTGNTAGTNTSGSVTIRVTGAGAMRTVSPFGVTAPVSAQNGLLTLPVGELPSYLELSPGQSIEVVPTNWGPNLALAVGTTAVASGDPSFPGNPEASNDVDKIINGKLENWYGSQRPGDHGWTSNVPSFPATVEVGLPQPKVLNHVVIYASVPWQLDGTLLDYQLQAEQNGQWVTVTSVSEPAAVVKQATLITRTRVDTFHSGRCVFEHSFAPIITSRIRLVVNDTTWGGGANLDVVNAGGQTGFHQISLREIELYNDSPVTLPPDPEATPTPVSAPIAGSLKARYYPRSEFAYAMTGGYFEGSSDATNWVNLGTITSRPPADTWSEIQLGSLIYRYLRYVSPAVTNTVLAELQFYDGSTRLSGRGFGSAGSFDNWGNGFSKALDNNTTTFFDAPDVSNSFVGIDLGVLAQPNPTPTPTATPTPTPGATNLKARYYPRADFAHAMTGGYFEGSNNATNWVNLGVITSRPPADTWSEMPLGSTLYRYLRYMSPGGQHTVLAELQFYNGSTRLTGTGLGTAGSYGNGGNGFSKALDNNVVTFFDAPTTSSSFVGIDLGITVQPTPTPTPTPPPTGTGSLMARYYPRAEFAHAMTGGRFEGSSDGNTWANLGTITSRPPSDTWSEMPLGSTLYRYLRYASPGGQHTVLAELQFYNGSTLLTGTSLGTAGSYNNWGNSFHKAFDYNITTFFDAPTTSSSYVGIDRGAGS